MKLGRLALVALLAVLGGSAVEAKRHKKDDDSGSSSSKAPTPAAVAVPPKGTGSCVVMQTIEQGFSKLDVKGELNGHDIELSKKEEARPAGTVEVTLNIPCPNDVSDMAEPFSFTMSSPDPVLIMPQKDLTIKASIVSIQVDKLQIKLSTPEPISVDGAEFAKEGGLFMQVVSGTATAMGHSFPLVGFETSVPFEGYFDVLDKKELVLHLINFNARFDVDVHVPKTATTKQTDVEGYFAVKGFITDFGDMPSSVQAEVAAHVTKQALGALRQRDAGSLLLAAGGSAAGRAARALAGTVPAAAGDSEATAAAPPSDSLAHVTQQP